MYLFFILFYSIVLYFHPFYLSSSSSSSAPILFVEDLATSTHFTKTCLQNAEIKKNCSCFISNLNFYSFSKNAGTEKSLTDISHTKIN